MSASAFVVFLAMQPGRLQVRRRRCAATHGDLALVLICAALAQTLEFLRREVAEGLRDRVRALRLCRGETVGAGRVVAVDEEFPGRSP